MSQIIIAFPLSNGVFQGIIQTADNFEEYQILNEFYIRRLQIFSFADYYHLQTSSNEDSMGYEV